MSENVFASAALVVKLGVTPFKTGSAEYGLSRMPCSAALVMNFTNSSAPVLFFVFLNTERLIPAMKLATFLPPAGAGNGTTPYWSAVMPAAVMLLSALFWLTSMAALPLAKSLVDWVALSY